VEEVTKIHGQGFGWQNRPINGQAVYVGGGMDYYINENWSIFAKIDQTGSDRFCRFTEYRLAQSIYF
jgi:hypothetical protein